MNFLVGLLAGYILLVIGLFIAQRNLLYHPDDSKPEPIQYGLKQMEVVSIPTEDGLQLYGWWQPPSHGNKPVIIYFHGNAGNIGYRAEKLKNYLDYGIGILLVTWRYNAGTGGKPSEASLIVDGRAAQIFVRNKGIDDKKMVLYGESLGSGIAVALGVESSVGAVILGAPFTSIADVAQHHYWYVPAKWLIHDKFDSRKRVGDVYSPIMIIHGDQDRIIPIKFGQALFEAASKPKEIKIIIGGSHDDLYNYGAAQLIYKFIEQNVL